jgi:hypothetical protein
MSRFFALLGAGLLACAAPGEAQRVSPVAQPAPNSPQRRALMDALRPRIERVLEAPVEFVVTRAAVRDGWALVIAEPQRPGGGRIDGRRYFPHDWVNMDGLTVSAILRFHAGRWALADHTIGATDVWYCGMRGPPRALTGC